MSNPTFAGHGALAGVHQQKTAGAVGIFHFAGLETRLADQRRLLIAQNPGDGHAFDFIQRGFAVNFAAGANFRQHRARNFKCGQQLRIPIERLQIEQLRAAGVGYVRDVHSARRPAGKIPHQKRIDISKQKVACGSSFARAGDIGQYPANFQRAEIGAQRQAGLRAKAVLSALGGESRHVLGHARVLPHDGIGDRLAGFAVPHHRRFALIGDADGRQVFGAQVPLRQSFGNHFAGAAQNFQRVVFDPARARENLLVFLLGQRDHAGCLVKHHEARAGSALIDRANVAFQGEALA